MTVKLSLVSILVCAVLSLVATLASYLYYTKPLTVDAEFLYRGWPLYWTEESWSGWSGPPYPHHFIFQTLNFLADVVFYAIIFQIPAQLYRYAKDTKEP